MPQEEQNQTPNLVFYEVLTGTLDTGINVLVQLFRKPDGTISLAQMAFRTHQWQTWGTPIRLQHVSTTPNEDKPA